ncbi:MAG: transcriptional regulator, GntR family [Clostridia bacterium]|jgi:K+/H+ antiporter YhaU regulatory subunit KhtT|uniref:TrkA C-terminal domain-containing protein n=1 Tax=Petroclostridium xylanilyticum TaxID=1792311 RepID=UPI000B983A96|nr:TrkA C-terminal domain-containing protein [Petroclostridium xylanilyticum]MBZ4647667.1 transcriptional regulator, GntR family [Clostridia bacterium]
MSKSSLSARYQQIALDIAQRIVNKEFSIGEKIHGRSVLASMYNVSPETIRKAVALLQDMDVLQVNQGSGIVINSIDKAYNFIQRFKYLDSVSSLKHDLEKLIEQKKQIDEELEKTLNSIIEYSDKLKNLSPYNPVEVEVSEKCPYIGSSISEMKFWQNTGGTVVALRKGDNLIVSPGPYAVLEEGDVIVVVGGNDILKDVEKFINGKDSDLDSD